MRTDSIRPAAVAGTWYPGTAGALARDVDRYAAAVNDAEDLPRGRVDAIIAPHAGLMFSGPVGAYSYKAAALGAGLSSSQTIVLVGPSHYVAFDGVALYPSGAFDCPLGPVPIDAQLGEELLAACPEIRAMPDVHRREHSLEMQLPFIRRLLPEARIVPLLMGYQSRDTIYALADALGRVARDRAPLLVASTDLSHYFDAETAQRLDEQVREFVSVFDPEWFMEHFEHHSEGQRGRYVACGGGPAIAVMLAARARGAKHGRVLKYMHSGQISGDNTQVVGYLAAALGSFTDVH
jgi:MEMO1 family protein